MVTMENRVGLLSMQRVNNYGSFWQAYCLKGLIEEHTQSAVEFIDIIPGDIQSRTSYKKKFSLKKLGRIPYYCFQHNKNAMFKKYQNLFLNCSLEPNYQSNYDSIIIGSDEVFNCKQESPWGFSTQLYGDIDNSNVNTYAACFGYTTIDYLVENNRTQAIINGFSNIKNMSVRDENSVQIVDSLIGKKPPIHLDPVLVGTLPQDYPSIKPENYILIYSYDFRMSDSDVIRQVKEFAHTEGLKIISVGFYQDWVDKNVAPNPIELLSYFHNAKYVVTDTFHGTIFSVRTHRRFLTILRETNEQKLGDLLDRIGMSERKIVAGDVLAERMMMDIDYDAFEVLREKEKQRTIQYLKSCIERPVAIEE